MIDRKFIEPLKNQEIKIRLSSNGIVLYGILKEIGETSILLFNQRYGPKIIDLNDISEVMLNGEVRQ